MMPHRGWETGWAAPVARTFVVVLSLNAVFFSLAIWVARLPREPFVARVREAFAIGELGNDDYLPFDSHRGYHQYNDCLILQMITNGDHAVLANAVAPLVYVANVDTWNDQCATLRQLIDKPQDRSQYALRRYARYWHGYNPIVAALLLKFNLTDVRRALKLAVYAALVVLVATAGGANRALFAAVAAIAATGAAFWGIPYFGQSLHDGPGDTFVVLGIASLLLFRKHLSRMATFVPFCAAYGASLAYLEMFTGLLPTGAAWMFAIAYLAAASSPHLDTTLRHAWTFAIAGLIAMTLGAAATVAIKLALSVMFLGHEAANVFAGHLKVYMSPYAGPDGSSTVIAPFAALIRAGSGLTYGSRSGATVLFGGAALAWLIALYLTLRRHSLRRSSDFLAFIVAAAAMPLWVLLFQYHTGVHAFLTVRLFIIPISLGLAAMVWQLSASRDATVCSGATVESRV
jgi:hypothetical protein